ncbi:hypothetical protein Cgig2_029131 [Carnegiea gigantea]|uniref:Uncharacterized protein n=1 Tax=Carnegiea gigantea TaxID=171969 RepID=A0A9Q1KKJ4_9CARY|nr:hypothetical protein Cgig2_029131 [Carnegiea gigantea]
MTSPALPTADGNDQRRRRDLRKKGKEREKGLARKRKRPVTRAFRLETQPRVDIRRLVAINMNALFSRSKFIVGVRMESGKIGELVMLLLIIWRFDILFVYEDVMYLLHYLCFLVFTIQGNVEMQKSDDLALFVYEQDSNENILVHRISPDDIYRKQEGIKMLKDTVLFLFSFIWIQLKTSCCFALLDTIISWRDPLYSTELAISFREVAGCSYIWYLILGALLGFISFSLLVLKFLDHICNVQRNSNFGTLNDDTFHGFNSDLRELPTVALSTLPLILKLLVEISSTLICLQLIYVTTSSCIASQIHQPCSGDSHDPAPLLPRCCSSSPVKRWVPGVVIGGSREVCWTLGLREPPVARLAGRVFGVFRLSLAFSSVFSAGGGCGSGRGLALGSPGFSGRRRIFRSSRRNFICPLFPSQNLPTARLDLLGFSSGRR